MEQRRPYPELVVALASAAWGLFWIPLRAFERHGLDPAWATLTQFLAPLAIMMAFAVLRLLRRQPTGIQLYRTGLPIGAAVALYLESLLLTDVARALILFYAMPAWGTALEVGLMGRPLTRWRRISLLPLAALGQPPSLEQLSTLAPWLVLIAVGFLIPVMWGVYWGSRHVDPGRLGILLQIEAVVGVGSAALLAGEPFGVRQAIGAVLVISAGLVEVIGHGKGTKNLEEARVTPPDADGDITSSRV